jgi:hypothetical protein
MPPLAGFEQAPKAVQAMWCYARDINEWHEQAGAAVEAYNNAMAAGALGLPERVRVPVRGRHLALTWPGVAKLDEQSTFAQRGALATTHGLDPTHQAVAYVSD